MFSTGGQGTSIYLLSFVDQDGKDGAPVFFVYAKEKRYPLSAQSEARFFKSGNSYDWLVVGIDQKGNIFSESKIRSFFVEDSE